MAANTSILAIPNGPALLPWALRLDAIVTGANGAAYLVAAEPLGDLFGVPASGLRALGAFLAAFAIAVWLVASRPATPAVWTVVAANAVWVAASAAFIAVDAWSPSTAGVVWTAMQASVVGAFAALQATASGRS